MPDYHHYRSIIDGLPLPLLLLDGVHFQHNCHLIKSLLGNKKIRIATKSIRSLGVLKKIQQLFHKEWAGLMCYSLDEAIFLSQHNLGPLLIGYPETNSERLNKIATLVKNGHDITLMADHKEQLIFYQNVAKKMDVTFKLCLDIDMSTAYPGLFFGVMRSSLHSMEDIETFLQQLALHSHLKLTGVMGYEAQIAGISDRGSSWPKQALIGMLKKNSNQRLQEFRRKVVTKLESKGLSLEFVNGGGSGSLPQTTSDNSVTEVTVGSAFYAPTLFDHYHHLALRPALFFALEITRKPFQDTVTCRGGGYIASGGPGPDKMPTPYLFSHAHFNKFEWAGEVQTPVIFSSPEQVKIGDPFFFRPAKAAEICERFQQIHLLDGHRVAQTFSTYRGDNQCFL